MEGAFLLEISKKIKECRLLKKQTLQELAISSGVTKGLISQIENGRSIPSLPVLFSIIKSLEVPVGDFFSDIAATTHTDPVIVRKRADYEDFEKEHAIGFFYHRILVRNMNASTIDIVLLTLEPGAHRPMVQTEAYEYKYILSGSVEYVIGDQTYAVEAGDSLFFDGRIAHTPRTVGNIPSVMLIVYFFDKE